MQCLSLIQPWALLVVAGRKRYETRSWGTSYRGMLGIHASRTWRPDIDDLCRRGPFRTVLRALGFASPADLPRGVLLGTVELVEVMQTEVLAYDHLSVEEHAFGDFRFGRYAWQLANPVVLAEPRPLRGMPGLFETDERSY